MRMEGKKEGKEKKNFELEEYIVESTFHILAALSKNHEKMSARRRLESI
jgi:hypothetical protein